MSFTELILNLATLGGTVFLIVFLIKEDRK